MSEAQPRRVSFDTDRLSGGAYYWPLAHDALASFIADAVDLYAGQIKISETTISARIVPYVAIGPAFVLELAAIYQALALRRACVIDHVQVSVSPHDTLWRDSLGGKGFRSSATIEKLRRALPMRTARIDWLKRWKDRIYAYLDIEEETALPDLRQTIIETAPSSLHYDFDLGNVLKTEQAEALRWFYGVGAEDLRVSLLLADKALEHDIMSDVQALLIRHGIDQDEHAFAHIQRFLSEGAALCRVHLERLLAQPDQIPSFIKTPADGDIWSSLLRAAVVLQGGQAAILDEGGSFAPWRLPFHLFAAFWGAQYYVTFNQGQAGAYRAMRSIAPLGLWSAPDVICAPAVRSEGVFRKVGRFFQTPGDKSNAGEIRRIVLACEAFQGDKPNAFYPVADLPRAEWLSRIIPELRGMGYEVIVAVPPRGRFLSASRIKSMGGVLRRLKPHQIPLCGQIVIVDNALGAAFRACMETDIPLVLYSMHDMVWSPEARALFGKRAAIIRAEILPDQRFGVSATALAQAMEQALDRAGDDGFWQEYYS